ncbi:MAG: DUF3450 domain-containing protein [Desulfarculaceae bacterium]
MNKKKNLLALLVACLFFCLPYKAGWAADSDQVRTQAREQVGVRQKTQKMIDRLSDERLALADRLETLQREFKTIQRQRLKTEAYVKDMNNRVGELQRRAREFERMSKELEPYWDQVAAELEDFVARDLPFLAEERKTRLDKLRATLNRYGAPAGAKMRSLLNVLEIEARYGSTVSCTETVLEIAGSRVLVRVLRLGRLALFALSSDGNQAWSYHAGKGEFVPLEGYQVELSQAADMASRKRVVELVEIPLYQPGPDSPAPEKQP